jgi:hypothetical protein
MKVDIRLKDMDYICDKSLPKMPTVYLRKIAEHLNDSHQYNIPVERRMNKTIINFMSAANIKTKHYWASFDYIFKSGLAELNNDILDIKKRLQNLNL